MKIKQTFRVALASLKTNKLRSTLTILGIVIGITSIMIVMSVGNSAEKMILGEIGGMGPEIIVIRPGRQPKGPSDFSETLLSNSLTVRDIEALSKKSNVPYLADIAPSVIVPGGVSYGGETYQGMNFGWGGGKVGGMFFFFSG